MFETAREFTEKTKIPQKDKLKRDTKRTHVGVKETMKLFKSKQKAKRKGGLEEVDVEEKFDSDELLLKNVIADAPVENVDSREWRIILSIKSAKLKHIVTKFFTTKSQKKFYDAYNEALKAWDCSNCHSFDASLLDMEWMECPSCDKWFHQKCFNTYEPAADGSLRYQCKGCDFVLQGTETIDSEGEVETVVV